MFWMRLSGSRVMHRVAVRYAAGPLQLIARHDDFLAGGRIHEDRRNGMGNGLLPRRANIFHLLAHADRINPRRGRERAHHHGHVVAPPLGIDDMGEQEGAPFVFRHAAEELPAHQRMQLGVFVDRPVHPDKQALALQLGEMLLEIEPGAHPPLCRGAGELLRAVCHRCFIELLIEDRSEEIPAQTLATMERSVFFAKSGGSVYSIPNACMELAPGAMRACARRESDDG
jgi:hypothetical protein